MQVTVAERHAKGRAERREGVQPRYPTSIFELPHFLNIPASEGGLSERLRTTALTIFDFTEERAPMTYLDPKAAAEALRMPEERLPRERTALIVSNNVTGDETCYNPGRARRPMSPPNPEAMTDLRKRFPRESCSFEKPLTTTPTESEFPAPRGERAVSFPNAFPFVGSHAVVVDPEVHFPEELTEGSFVDMMNTAVLWSRAVQANENSKVVPVYGMNMFPTAGGSILHPHLQILQREKAFKKVDRMMRDEGQHKWFQTEVMQAALKQGADFGPTAYFDQLGELYARLGMAFEVGNSDVVFDLTPLKDMGTIVRQRTNDTLPTEDFSRALFSVMSWMRDKHHVTGFNMVVYMPPMGVDIQGSGDWHQFPVWARLTKRTDVGAQTHDTGFMENSVAPVVSTDQVALARSYAGYYGLAEAA